MTTRKTIAAAALFALHQRRGSDLVDAPTTTMSPVFGLLNRLILLSPGEPCSRNRSISTGIACANLTAARNAKQCASQACRNEIFTPSYWSWRPAASRCRRSSREWASYLDCICHRSFRRMGFCSGDEGGALEYLTKTLESKNWLPPQDSEVAPALA
jgi:hypothetical protein